MTEDVNHIEKQSELNKELLEMISGSSITWSSTKEEIWPDMLKKIEGKSSETRNTRVVYLQLKRLAAAAVFLILSGIPAVMYFYTRTIENLVVQKSEVLLPDNSRVIVGAQSVLSYKPLLWKFTRTIKFEGEAFFDVQKGNKFEVVSKRGKTVVLGTQFDIYSRDNDYTVTCVSGKVKVIESVFQNEVIVTTGYKAILKPDGTFGIQSISNTRQETMNKPQNQSTEEEQNEILSKTATEVQPANNKHDQVSANKQAAVKEQAAVREKDQTRERDAIKEQKEFQNQSEEEEQNKEQSNTTIEQAGNKEPGQSQNQEKEMDQSTGNQQSKNKFGESLTPEQLSILENQKMSKEERRKAFMESLSDEQRRLLEEQIKERAQQSGDKKAGENVKKDLQKNQTREQVRENTGPGKESQEQQFQQTREKNKETTKPGGENKPVPGNENKPGNK